MARILLRKIMRKVRNVFLCGVIDDDDDDDDLQRR
jgi:hypothetical protein